MLAPCEVGYVGRTCCHLLQCLLFWMIDPEIWSALALSSRTLVGHRTLIQPGPLNTVWKHSSFGENAPLQQHCHWCHILYTYCHPVINCPVPSLLHSSFLTLKHIRSHYPIPCCTSSTWKISAGALTRVILCPVTVHQSYRHRLNTHAILHPWVWTWPKCILLI